MKTKIEQLQPHRNTVMHNKRMTKDEYEKVRKSLKAINKLLIEAISMIEDEMYTDTKLIDVVSAFGNMCAKILGSSIVDWAEKMKPALASLGRIVIESAMPKINIPAVMPDLNLGADLVKRFEQVYKMPALNVSNIQNIQGAFASINNENIDTLKSIYDNAALNWSNQIAEQVNRLSSVYNMPDFTSPSFQDLNKI